MSCSWQKRVGAYQVHCTAPSMRSESSAESSSDSVGRVSAYMRCPVSVGVARAFCQLGKRITELASPRLQLWVLPLLLRGHGQEELRAGQASGVSRSSQKGKQSITQLFAAAAAAKKLTDWLAVSETEAV